MKKFSIIIPTLWKSDLTSCLLNNLENCKYINEIILIENSFNAVNFTYSKLIRVSPPTNLYVNPSWNLGVKLASNEHIILCNDDIFFNPDLLFEEIQNSIDDITLLGVHPNSYKTYINSFNIQEGNYIGQGWGCLMFLKKSLYIPIPDVLKIWYGDNWLVNKINPSYSFTYPIYTKMSTTSSLSQFNSIIQNDIQEWHNLL